MVCTENCGLGKRSRFRKQIMPTSTQATKKQKTIKNIVDIMDLKKQKTIDNIVDIVDLKTTTS
jgi:hypothetical protein